MSLEESMKAVTDSNNKLAESNVILATALTNYGNILNSIANADPSKVVVNQVAAAGEAAAPAGRAKPGPKPKPAPAAAAPAAEDDGFGDEGGDEAAASYTAEDVKNKLMEVKDAYGDKAPALKVINDLGYKAIPDVQPKDYGAVMAACDKLLKAKK